MGTCSTGMGQSGRRMDLGLACKLTPEAVQDKYNVLTKISILGLKDKK